ncbi:MAG: type IV secretion system DNA-binding domain-containing protein [Chloroflexota bacterium]|nr:type IV secretion system DNA-binding domain-containing protein [Chloroflexota bacterium]MDE2842641.1 type IV secretion system DNA-binding domain-containing protein [Chloroflexota bacterium]
MSINVKHLLFGEKPATRPPALLAVVPHRTGERTLLGVENLLQSVAVPEPFSLELAGDMDGVTLLARCMDDRVVKQQLASHYPQARVREVVPEDDPMRRRQGELAWGLTLRAGGPEYVPLRCFRDEDLLDPGSDPLLAVIGALSSLRPGERIVSRLLLRSLGPEWSQAHQAKAHKRAVPDPRDPSYTYHTRPLQVDGVTMAVLGAGALAALRGYLWVQDGEIFKASLLGLGSILGMVLAGWAWWRWKQTRSRVYDPLLIREKVSRIAFDAELQLTAFLPAEAGEERAFDLLESVAAAYRHYDHPAGARFKAGKIKPLYPTAAIHPAGPGIFGKRSVLGVREASALWHPPGAGDETPLVERSGSRSLAPQPRNVRIGAPVGEAPGSIPGDVHFSDDLLRRHHLYVARTRMGKSTLMQHVVAHKLREKAAGRDRDSIIVVDPHADLVASLLEQVPASIVDRVRLIDLADDRGAPGINLLDTRIFADRDRTADSVVRVARGLWDQWGPRMQSILEHTVKTLHEANESQDAAEQYTILDGMRLISDGKFRADALARVTDPYLLEWWARDFNNWHRQYRSEAIAPVQTRLAYYASSKKARSILGQSRSTIDIRQTVLEGGILFVSTAQGTVGRDVAALVGASLLNLVDSVIREQEGMPQAQRRGALVVVDEMQSMPGVDYESMLSELGKYGASFILATQSLAKLDDISRTLQDTILANVGCLAVFQVSGGDARRLVWELGKDRVSEDDITSLPVHHCYVRATVGTDRLPSFSMMVRKPEPGDAQIAASIRASATGYTTRTGEIATASAEGERKLSAYQRQLLELPNGHQPDLQQGEPEPEPGRNKQRSRRSPAVEDVGETFCGSEDGEE